MPEYKVKEEDDAKKMEAEAARLSAQGKQSEANALLIRVTQSNTVAGQQRLFDLSLFNQWLNVHVSDTTQLTKVYEVRFRPEFRPAFEAWLAKDPFNNPNAPPGPLYMPQYAISEGEEAKQLAADAERLFTEGEDANQISDNYVLNGVFLAVCLFFLAIGERFKGMPVRVAVLIMAIGMSSAVCIALRSTRSSRAALYADCSGRPLSRSRRLSTRRYVSAFSIT